MLICLVVPYLGGGCVRGGRVLDQYLGMAISSILLPCLGQTTKSTLSCFKAIYCMTKLLQEIKFMLQSLIYFWKLGANFIKQIKSIMYCMQYPVYNWGQTCTKLYTLFRTNFCEIVYPVWDRGQKPSLHRPYKGLHPQVPKQHLQKFWNWSEILRAVKWFLKKAVSWKILAHSLILEALFMGL